MATVIVRIVVGTPRTGLWCVKCLLPSVIEVDALSLTEHGVSVIATVRQCGECS